MIGSFNVTRAMVIVFILGLTGIACDRIPQSQAPQPPIAKAIPNVDTLFGDIRVDNYHWLRDKANPDVINYLRAENAYTDSMTAHLQKLQGKLYDETIGRLSETDTTAPMKIDDYFYYARTVKDSQYPVHCRKHGSLKSDEQVLLDLNDLAKTYKYISLGAFRVSPNHCLLAYAIDTSGWETYSVFIKDLETSKLLSDAIINIAGDIEWANDNRTLFYSTQDSTQRPYRLYRHGLGTAQETDELLYQENDGIYWLGIGKTRSKKFIVLDLQSMNTSEQWVLDADTPGAKLSVVAPRKSEIEYHIEHHGSEFFIATNENAKNFKVVAAPVESPDRANWREFIPHDDSVKIEGIEAFENHLVVSERSEGLSRLRVVRFADQAQHYIDFPDPAYSIDSGPNPVYKTATVRFQYSSLVTPRSVFDYHMENRVRQLVKQDNVRGYAKEEYRTVRVFANSSDSIAIPIVLAYKNGLFRNDGSNPAMLEGYGAYGIPSDPYFSSSVISLLDRGFIFAVAQVRGGGELGRWWYEDGKLLKKKNTFHDFIACTEHLIENKYTSSGKIAIIGGSAGGLLIGAVLNKRPDLYGAAFAGSPFVDALNTMLDPSIPLTVVEYEEWGNPRDSTYYAYMKSYSPYDNVDRKAYPPMLVMGGLNDPRVGFWEPAKWVAKLRSLKIDHNALVLKTNMGEGHFGVSGRYARLREVAFEHAFCLDALGVKE